MRKYATCLALLGFLTAPTYADLKITSNVDNSGMAAAGNGVTVTYIKNMKMRTDSEVKGRKESLIIDVDKRQMILLNHKKKRAEVIDLTPMAEQQVALGTGDVSLKATGKTRTVAGYTCEDHNVSVTISAGSAAAPGMNLDVAMEGPVCLSKQAPGNDEYFTLYKAMADRGLFWGPPEAAQAQPGQQRGMTQLYRTMAEKGVGLASDLEIGFEGSGMIAKMMKKMGFTSSTQVMEISDATLSSELFEVPAGYKVKNR